MDLETGSKEANCLPFQWAVLLKGLLVYNDTSHHPSWYDFTCLPGCKTKQTDLTTLSGIFQANNDNFVSLFWGLRSQTFTGAKHVDAYEESSWGLYFHFIRLYSYVEVSSFKMFDWWWLPFCTLPSTSLSPSPESPRCNRMALVESRPYAMTPFMHSPLCLSIKFHYVHELNQYWSSYVAPFMRLHFRYQCTANIMRR